MGISGVFLMIRFLAEIFERTEFLAECAIAASAQTDQEGRIVSKIDCIEHPTSSYWLDWGGTYDNPETDKISLYFDGFLSLEPTIADMVFSGNSQFRGGDFVYLATDFFPWQYPQTSTEIAIVNGYSTAVADETKPSDDFYGVERYPTRLKIPSLQIKLPDAISGSALQNDTFSFSLINNDGFFDLFENNNFFNVPAYIYKSFVDNPEYSDFTLIRRGFVDNISTTFEDESFSIATVYRSLTQSMVRIVSDVFPTATENAQEELPVAWGELTGVETIQIDSDKFVVVDPLYINSIDALYDSDGVEIDSADYTFSGGIITMLTSDDPATADIQAHADNTIGQIITTEIQDKGRILYSSGSWDVAETNEYITASPQVNFIYKSGSVRDMVAEILKSDNAFLIEKSNAKLSIRKWNGGYSEHYIDATSITQRPTRTFVNSKYFNSAVRVVYSGGEVFDDSQEITISEIYRKKQTQKYNTNLANESDAETLAESLLERYGKRAELWQVSLGVDTSSFSLLDTVYLDLEINGRRFTNANVWIIKQIDVAQDVLILEGVATRTTASGLLATPDGVGYNGDMSGVAIDSGAKLAQTYFVEDE
jgi:hypothetical protein